MNKQPEIIVWHEFGHVFGYILIYKLFNDDRKISEIFLLNKQNSKPYVRDESSLLKQDECLELIQFIIIFVMGAVFHATYFRSSRNEEVSFEDIKSLSINASYDLDINSLCGYAGSDFYKIERRLFEKGKTLMAMIEVKKFTFEIQKLLVKDPLFSTLHAHIEKFGDEFNGKNTKGDDLFRKNRDEILSLMSKELVNDIHKLINTLTYKLKNLP